MAKKKTGNAIRKAIEIKRNQGVSIVEIAKATDRDPSTISQIISGSIQNPPQELLADIRSIKPKKK